jgi:hypothetical protein
MGEYEGEPGQSEYAAALDAASVEASKDGDDYDDPYGFEIEGEHFPDLPGVVDGALPGETLEERNARLLQLNAEQRQLDRPEGTVSDPRLDELVRVARPTDRIRGSAVRVVAADGGESWREIGKDTAALVLFVQAHGQERGFSLEELRRPFSAGRPRPKERFRRKVLGDIVAAAKAAGAKTSAIEAVLALDRRRISELVAFD